MFKKIKSSNIINVLTEVSYLLIIFGVPVIFSFYLPSGNVFELSKTIFFRSLTAILLFLSLLRYFYLNSYNTGFNYFSSLHFWRKKFLAPLLFLGVVGFSLFFSINPRTSFWGDFDRQEGYLSFLFFGLFFILMVYNLLFTTSDKAFSPEARIKRIILTIVASGGLVSLYGILQILNIDFLYWSEAPFLTNRTISSLGQPNFLGSFLVLVLPLTVYLLNQATKFWWRFLWSFTLVLN